MEGPIPDTRMFGRRDFLRMGLLSIPCLCSLPASVLDLTRERAANLGQPQGPAVSLYEPSIKTIGIGRAGIRITNLLANKRFPHVESISIDCDPYDLESSCAQTKIHIPIPMKGLDLCPTMLRETAIKNENALRHWSK